MDLTAKIAELESKNRIVEQQFKALVDVLKFKVEWNKEDLK